MSELFQKETVLLCGEYTIETLSKNTFKALDSAMSKQFIFIIGDNDGVDLLFQHYLNYNNYRNVFIYTTLEAPKINIGKWAGYVVKPPLSSALSEEELLNINLCNICDSAIIVGSPTNKTVARSIQLLQKQNKPFYLIR